MSAQFKTARRSGKSDRQVIVEHVHAAAPGTIFEIDDIIARLSMGTGRTISKAVASAAVRSANSVLLKEHQRCLRAVRGVGYRMVAASEHKPLALERKRRADKQLQRGLEVLSHVRWDELTEEQRRAHEGTLIVVSALHSAMSSLSSRQDRLEEIIRKMR